MAGTNELDHLRKSAEDAIIEVQSISDLCHRECRDDYAAAPLANARATLYLAEVIRSGLAQLAGQAVVKSGPAPGWIAKCVDCGVPEAVKRCAKCGGEVCYSCSFTHWNHVEQAEKCVDCGKLAHPELQPCNDCGKRLCWECNFTHDWQHAIDVAASNG